MDNIPILSIRDILFVVFKRKRMVLTISFTTIGFVLGYILLFTNPLYESESQILIEAGQGFVYNPSLPTQGQIYQQNDMELEREITLSIEILNSDALVEKVIKKLGRENIYSDLEYNIDNKPYLLEQAGVDTEEAENQKDRKAAHELLKRLNVNAIDNSPIISINFQHENSFIASNVVNSLIELYVEYHLQLRKKPQLFKFFKEQYEVMRSRFESSETELRNFKQTHAISASVKEERNIYMNRLAQINLLHDKAVNNKIKINNRIEFLRKRLSTIYDPALTDKFVKEMLVLRFREIELIEKHGAKSISVNKIRVEINIKRAKYNKLINQKRLGSTNLTKAQKVFHQDLEKDLLDKEFELISNQAQIAHLVEKIDIYEVRLNELDAIESNYIKLNEHQETNRKNLGLYQTKFEEFRIFNALDKQKIASVKVLKQAHPAAAPLPSKRRLMLVFAIFFGVIGSLVFAFISEYLSGVFNTGQDVELYLQRTLLASIPDTTKNNNGNKNI
ncbi:MAG: Wzz/FepE/Etk N-terminal domain-containing protein [Pseudomonadota bacterium]